MNKLQEIITLINRLTLPEITNLRNNFLREGKKEKLKTIKLFDLLLSKDNLNSYYLQETLYGKENYHAFNKLLIRFETRIFDFLLSEKSLNNNLIYSKRNKIHFDLRKKMIIADILQLRGDKFYCDKLYRKIIRESSRLEFYDLQLFALLSFERLKNSLLKKNKSLENQIKSVQHCWLMVNQSRSEYNRILTLLSTSKSKTDYNKVLEKAVLILKDNYQSTSSPTIGFYYLNLKIELEQNKNEFSNATKTLEELKQIIMNYDSVYTDNRLGTYLINKAQNDLYVNDFNGSINYSIESQKYFKGHHLNQLLTFEVLFLAYLNNSNYEKCKDILIEVNKITLSGNEKLKNKFIYFEACLKFKLKEFDKSELILNQTNKFEFEKGDYFIIIKIIQILIYSEQKKTELIEPIFDTIQKYFNRNKKYFSYPKRMHCILSLIKLFINSNFNRKEIQSKKRGANLIKLLSSSEADYSWVSKSIEVFPVHEWFKFNE